MEHVDLKESLSPELYFQSIFCIKIISSFKDKIKINPTNSSNKVKDDNFLGQCEIPLVSTLPELKSDSPITLGQKDCVLR